MTKLAITSNKWHRCFKTVTVKSLFLAEMPISTDLGRNTVASIAIWDDLGRPAVLPAPLLFEDDDREGARAQRISLVEPGRVSERAKAEAPDKRTPDGLPVHGLTTLLADLATLS